MKAAYVQQPFKFEIRDVTLRDLEENEIIVDVKACGVCGHDLIMARYGATQMQQFGHEISGIVSAVGSFVTNVMVGDKVVLESGTFDRFSNNSRNGRVDIDNKGPNFWVKADDNMGFAQQLIVPCECAVKFEGLTFEETCVIEPLGVALDLVKTADIKIMNDVLVVGLGPIGLMAAKMAKALGARKVYGAEFSKATARIKLAKKWNIDEVICTDKVNLEDYAYERGIDRVLVTAPPSVIPAACKVCNMGAIIAFLGIDYGPTGFVKIDTTFIHGMTMQLRASNASPALYFPECIDIIKSGMINTQDLITHKFTIDEINTAIKAFDDDKANGIKAIMVNE